MPDATSIPATPATPSDAIPYLDGSTGSNPTLEIDTVFCATGARIGMTQCPGGPTKDTGQPRSLSADLQQLRHFGADLVVSLTELSEFSKLGVPQFTRTIGHFDLLWLHLPVPDMGIPGESFFEAWDQRGEQLLSAIKAGQTVVIHCAAGIGRTGLITASLLATFGATPCEAIESVRRVRLGTIETQEQERCVAALSERWRQSI